MNRRFANRTRIEGRRTKKGGIVLTRKSLIGLGALWILLIAILSATVGTAQGHLSVSASLAAAVQAPLSTGQVLDREVQGYKLSPEKYARVVAYRRGEYWLYFVTMFYTLLLLWALVRWRLAPRLRDWAERFSRRAWVQLLLFVPALFGIFGLFLLPTDAYDHWLKHKYGLSVQSWLSW